MTVYSLFDFDQYGDEKFGAESAPTDQQLPSDQNQSQQSGGGMTSNQNSLQQQQIQQQNAAMRAERPLDGKLEKSLMNFKNAHPNFDPSAAGKSVLNRIHAYKELKYVIYIKFHRH